MIIKQKSLSRLFMLLLLSNLFSYAQTEFFNSKILFSESDLDEFYSAISIDSSQVYYNANNYTVYAYDKNTGVLNWSYYTGYKSNNAPKLNKNNVLVGINNDKWVQLNAKTGDTIQTLKINGIETQPFLKGNIMYCAAISSEIGGAVIAYDIEKNEIVWQKYIGHGVSFQPYFFKDKIVVNYENQYWFELDYNGNALDKDTICYSKNTEPPFEERFCNIHYDVLNQFHKDVAVKNVTIEETKYHYAKNATVILNGNKLKIINEKNKVKKEIVIDKIITLLETDVNDYSEILKVEENTVWFMYENILGVYDFKKNKTIKAYDLSSWNPHQVILDGNNVWLISRNDGELVALELEKNDIDENREEAEKLEREKALRCTTPDKKTIEAKIEADKKLKNN